MLRVDGLDGRVSVVTGATRGIGRAIAMALQENGSRVAALDLEAPQDDNILGLTCDVTDPDSVDAAFATVERELGTVSVLVVNAGIYPISPFEQTSLELWRRTLDVNLTGGFLCCRRVLPAMRSQGYGRIVTIGSSAGKAGGARSVAAYAASKAGLMTMTKSIANEYAAHGITANTLAPALIDTEMISGMRDLVSRIPVGRFGTPEEVAALVCFLASAHAGYITGEVTDINGGFLVD